MDAAIPISPRLFYISTGTMHQYELCTAVAAASIWLLYLWTDIAHHLDEPQGERYHKKQHVL